MPGSTRRVLILCMLHHITRLSLLLCVLSHPGDRVLSVSSTKKLLVGAPRWMGGG